jgi:hypothetical protein
VVEAALQANLEVVAVTDHNGVGWGDRVRAAGRDRGLIVLPGFELAVLGGTHLLGIFDAGTSMETLRATLGSCGLPPEKIGDSTGYSKTSPVEVARIIAEQGGICIAAHADGKDGVLHTYLREGNDGKQHGGPRYRTSFGARSCSRSNGKTSIPSGSPSPTTRRRVTDGTGARFP